MCGIVGIAGDLNLRDEATMKRLLLLDSVRGMDSTGLAAVRMMGKEVHVAKTASHCFNLFDTKRFSLALNNNMSKAFIGHNRAATSGAIKDVNAHPFQCDHITGVHNGTLEDGDKAMLEKMLGQEYNVDSEALFAAIAKFGVKEIIPKLKKGRDHYKGAWSLVWWDAKDNRLNFLRNEHRPMWYCFSEDFKQIFWASEFWMLDAALEKAGTYKIWKKESDKTPGRVFRFFQTDTDVLLTLDVDALRKGGKERPKFHAAPLKGKEPEEVKAREYPFRTSGSEQHGTGCGSSTKTSHTLTSTNRTTKTTSSDDREPATIRLIGDVDHPYANYVQRLEFNHFGQTHKHTGNPVCNWCHEEVPFGLPGITVFFRDNVLICAKCSGNEEVSVLSDYAPSTRFVVTRSMFQEAR